MLVLPLSRNQISPTIGNAYESRYHNTDDLGTKCIFSIPTPECNVTNVLRPRGNNYAQGGFYRGISPWV